MLKLDEFDNSCASDQGKRDYFNQWRSEVLAWSKAEKIDLSEELADLEFEANAYLQFKSQPWYKKLFRKPPKIG